MARAHGAPGRRGPSSSLQKGCSSCATSTCAAPSGFGPLPERTARSSSRCAPPGTRCSTSPPDSRRLRRCGRSSRGESRGRRGRPCWANCCARPRRRGRGGDRARSPADPRRGRPNPSGAGGRPSAAPRTTGSTSHWGAALPTSRSSTGSARRQASAGSRSSSRSSTSGACNRRSVRVSWACSAIGT